MQDELEEVLTECLERAQKKEYTEPFKINSLREYCAVNTVRKQYNTLKRIFKRISKRLFNEYLVGLSFGIRETETLVKSKDFSEFANFYEVESNTLDLVRQEYLSYLQEGHVIDAFLGKERDEEE